MPHKNTDKSTGNTANATNIRLLDLSLLLKNEKALIIGDIHLGYEESLHKKGIIIPVFQLSGLLDRLFVMLGKAKPKTIIINGDLKHEFGRASSQEWRDAVRLIDFLLTKGTRKLILIKGNHDRHLAQIAAKKNIELRDYFVAGDTYVCHGHKIPADRDFKKAKTVIIGHEHPAVTVSDGIRAETYKAFLFGKYKGKRLIVMPSLSPVTEGTNVLRGEFLSPFLKARDGINGIDDFEAYIVSDKIYNFGKIGGLK
jgi:uncharacterized protein